MFYKAIVAYLDILGYQDLVRRAMGKEDLVKRIERLFYRTSIGAVEGLGNMDLSDIVKGGAKEEERYRQLVKRTRVRNNADSFIFVLPVPDVGLHSPETSAFIETYFLTITMFVIYFIAQIGYLLRGGVSIGNHYESERERQLFIFSEAHNRAVTLESKKADNPRIVMDEHLQLYFEQVSYPFIDRFFYKDEDGCYCLDIYYAITLWGNRMVEMLTHMKDGIDLCIENNFNAAKELGKLINFAKFHNKKVNRAKVNLPHLLLDIEKYEEQLRRLNSSSFT